MHVMERLVPELKSKKFTPSLHYFVEKMMS